MCLDHSDKLYHMLKTQENGGQAVREKRFSSFQLSSIAVLTLFMTIFLEDWLILQQRAGMKTCQGRQGLLCLHK